MKYECDIKMMAVRERSVHVAETCLDLDMSIHDVCFDDKHERLPLTTSRSAFSLPYEPCVTHRCVVQDDSVFSKNFRPFIQKLVNEYPKAIFSLFCGSCKVKNYPKGVVIRTGSCMWGPAVIIPKEYLSSIYSDLDEFDSRYKHDDVWYAKWAIENKVDILTTIPTSVNTCRSFVSSMGHNNICKSHMFEEGDIMQYDWKDFTKKSLCIGKRSL